MTKSTKRGAPPKAAEDKKIRVNITISRKARALLDGRAEAVSPLIDRLIIEHCG